VQGVTTGAASIQCRLGQGSGEMELAYEVMPIKGIPGYFHSGSTAIAQHVYAVW
jgi:hypothetical protein